MSDEKRCRKCKAVIEEGEYCFKCNFERVNKMDMRDTLNKSADFSERYDAMAENEAIQPPMPWKKD